MHLERYITKAYLKSTAADEVRIIYMRLDILVKFFRWSIFRGEDEIGIERIMSYKMASMSNSDELFNILRLSMRWLSSSYRKTNLNY